MYQLLSSNQSTEKKAGVTCGVLSANEVNGAHFKKPEAWLLKAGTMNRSACTYPEYPSGYTLPFSPCHFTRRKNMIDSSASENIGFPLWNTNELNKQQHVQPNSIVYDSVSVKPIHIGQDKLHFSSPNIVASPCLSKQCVLHSEQGVSCGTRSGQPSTPCPETGHRQGGLSKAKASPSFSTTPCSDYHLSSSSKRWNVRRAPSSSKYGDIMSMPHLPIPLADDIVRNQRQQTAQSAATTARLHDSTLLREIRSFQRPLYAEPPCLLSKGTGSNDRSLGAPSDIRGRTDVEEDDEGLIEFQLRCRHRRKKCKETSCTPSDKASVEPRPFLSPVKSQMRILRPNASSNQKLGRTKRGHRLHSTKEITVDFSARRGSPRKKILKKEARQIMEEMVGLSVVDEKKESYSSSDADEEKENSLDIVGPSMPCRLPPLRRRNAIQRSRRIDSMPR